MDINFKEIIIGIFIGVAGYMMIDIKSYIDDYIKPNKEFHSIIEDLYLKLMFENMETSEITGNIDMLNPNIPNYFKYAIKKNDYEAIESIIVINYLNMHDENFPIRYNLNRFLLIGSLFGLMLMLIPIIFLSISIIVYGPFFLLINYIKSHNNQLIYPSVVIYIIYIFLILKLVKKIRLFQFGLVFKNHCENSYKSECTFYKNKYKKLCKNDYKLNIFKDN